MSRAYRISVRDSVRKDVSGSDEICADLELLDILPADQMRSLLADELRKRGFTDSNGKVARTRDGVTISVDPQTGHVNVAATQSESVDIESERDAMGFDDLGPKSDELKKRLQVEVAKDLDHRVRQHEKELQVQATSKLSEALADVSKELDQVVNATTREALKRKAATLGTVREISEDAEAGSLTIKVEV